MDDAHPTKLVHTEVTNMQSGQPYRLKGRGVSIAHQQLLKQRSPWHQWMTWLLAIVFGLSPSLVVAATVPIPEQEDGALQVWNEKTKYYLVISVDQQDVPGAKLSFTLTDAVLVAKQFEALGYRPLVKDHIVGSLAEKETVITALRKIRDLPEWASVVIYYSGHGVASPDDKDVALQLADQTILDYGLGIKVSDLIESARDKNYNGELHLIIDACFSGTGAFTGALTLKELGPKTTILTSSATTQNSIAITLANGTKLSAFTHALLQATGKDWAKADDNGDGILRFGEIHTYSSNQLTQWYLEGRLTVGKEKTRIKMNPQLIGGRHQEVILAYDRTKVQRWASSSRQALQLVALERNLVPTQPVTATNGTSKPEIPQEAQLLAKQLTPKDDDPYAQGIKAQAQGRLDEADTLLAQALDREAAHEERLAKIYLARGRNETYKGNYKNALPWYKKRIALRPTKDPALLNEFGQAWQNAGLYDQALPYYTEALAIREKNLSRDDPDLAISLNNLALLYETQGKYAEAEPLYQRAIQIDEVALGPNHPGLATDLNNLALLYETQGKYAEAEPLYQRALAINEQALGADHPQVALNLNNLALLYKTQGKYAEAEPLYQRALRISETALGPTHPSVAIRLNNLAALYDSQGKYAEAEPLYQRALAINEQALGADHPQVALNLNNLAALYDSQGKYAEAEPLYQRAIQIDEVALGPNHPGLATDLNNLALLYKTQGKYAEAEPLYQRAYDIVKARLGLDHPNTKTVLSNYVDFLMKAEWQEKLIPLVPDLRTAFPGIFAESNAKREMMNAD
ncbi:MAG: hypothetical protein NPIRA01_15660 [Nitrospirales bacterium]|nr:MAG: hypothetical protein NPIRA01_15660 [Nitrospirales bacterium]